MMFLSEITFPAFGICVDPSRVAFYVGSKPVYWYGVIIAVGFTLAVLYGVKRAPRFGLTQDHILDGVLWIAPFAIICTRAYYCIFNWDLFRDDPITCLYIWDGGLAIYGGIIGAVIGIIVYTRIRKLSTLAVADVTSICLLIGQCIGRWGNFFNREAHGVQTDSLFRMGLRDASGVVHYYHPTFLYESVWNLIGFLLLHSLVRRRKYDGQIFTLYIAWYGLGRMVIEGLRTDSLYLFHTGIRVSQLVAAVSFAGALAVLIWQTFFRKHDPSQLYVNRVAAQTDEPAQEDESQED